MSMGSTVNVISRRELDAIRQKVSPVDHCFLALREAAMDVESKALGGEHPRGIVSAQVGAEPVDTNAQTRRTLQKQSEERASKWPNTLQAVRVRKEKARQERMAAEEAERVKIDKKEATLREENRRQRIERANRMLFDDTDKVKAFHSSLLMSDVLKEREAQIEYKKQIAALKKAQDQAFHEEQVKAIEAGDEAELLKLKEHSEKALEQKKEQMQQLDRLKKRILAEREENRLDGEEIRRRAIEEVEELREKERAARERAIRAHRETLDANRALQAFRLRELEREREADRAIVEYSNRQAELMEERAAREAEKAAKKESNRKRMMEIMEKNYLDEQAKAEARLERNIAQSEEKRRTEENTRKALRQEELEAIHRSHQQQMRIKKENKQKQKWEEQAMAEAWKARTEEIQQEERHDVEQRREKDIRTMEFLKHQVATKQLAKERRHQEHEEVVGMLQMSLREEEERFQRYAAECVEEWGKSGKSTKPMDLYLTKKDTLDTL